ncbi:hypothetical protein MASR2M78_00220 [Treponema sp.]
MIKKYAWIPFAASRYVSSRRRDKSSPSSLFSILGIATGVMALIVVIAVMNGFQLGFIESILEISSFHLRLELSSVPASASGEMIEGDQHLLTELRAQKNIAAVLPFIDTQTIAKGAGGTQQACLVRGIPSDALLQDAGLASKLSFEEGSFDIQESQSILLGSGLAQNLGLEIGDELELLSISGQGFSSLDAEDLRFRITGIFRSGFYDYDLGWAFVNLTAIQKLAGEKAPYMYGIKLKDRWKDEQELTALKPDSKYARC